MKGIRVILSGRSGNNLFQYAAGRAIATRLDVPLILDSSLIDGETWKVSAHLLRLPLKAIHRRDPTPVSRWFHRSTGRLVVEIFGGKVVREPIADLSFRPEILEMQAGTTLHGFFQSPLYFASIDVELHAELAPSRWSMSEDIAREGERIAAPGGVAVHCRRGDYVNNPNADLLGPGYFRQAMDEMRRRISGCRFHVFSDDVNWCREQFTEIDVEIENHTGAKSNPLIDWFLMSRANHHILSNSSYAWWAAWFGRKPGQTVLVPPVWFEGIIAPVREKCLPHWELFQPKGGVR
ncbi:MAG: alpha-1,2-fucosyltransferase [Verrucomicrobiales bacterium]